MERKKTDFEKKKKKKTPFLLFLVSLPLLSPPQIYKPSRLAPSQSTTKRAKKMFSRAHEDSNLGILRYLLSSKVKVMASFASRETP